MVKADKIIKGLNKLKQWAVSDEIESMWTHEVEKIINDAIEYVSDLEWRDGQSEVPVDEDQEYICVLDGKDGNVTYHHGIVTGCWCENGEWYLGDNKIKANVIAWRPLPGWEKDE